MGKQGKEVNRAVLPLLSFCDWTLETIIPHRFQRILYAYLESRLHGRRNDDPSTNGEYKFLSFVGRFFRGDPVVLFDVGANVGNWTIPASRCFDHKACIYSFEPSTVTFKTLTKAVENLVSRVRLFNFGLSEEESSCVLFVAHACAGTNSLYRRPTSIPQPETEQVIVRNGDSFCNEHKIERIHLLKIDTEGHELSVLKGLVGLLSSHKIDFIQFEYGDCWLDSRTSLREVFELLTPRGYRLGKLLPHRIEMIPEYHSRYETFVYSNYVAVAERVKLNSLRL